MFAKAMRPKKPTAVAKYDRSVRSPGGFLIAAAAKRQVAVHTSQYTFLVHHRQSRMPSRYISLNKGG